MTSVAKHAKQSGLRSTARLLREAATPEVYLRAFKTFKQGAPAGTGLGFLSAQQTSVSKWEAVIVAVVLPIWSAIQSFWDNTVDNAQKLLNDAPTQKEEVIP